MKERKKVLVGMSGGVDSSVAAKLLKDEGYEVAGVFLNFWKDEGTDASENKCCSLESLIDARKVAAKIGIPLYTLDFSSEFKKTVVDNFLLEYASGNTPNPCIVCNKKIKVGRLIKYATAMGYDYVATGHYLKIEHKKGKHKLYKAKDGTKDQTYFLYTFNQEELSRLLFPLGKYNKSQVRNLAKKHDLSVASKAESQDICFLSGSHNNFLKKYLDLSPGPITLRDTQEVIGEHSGLPLYTIGQRRGIEIGGTGPYYVADFDYDKNILYVVRNWNEDILYKKSLEAVEVNWLSGEDRVKDLTCEAVIRYGHKSEKCLVKRKSKKQYLVEFEKKQRAITPGQSIVFYSKNELLGGGTIK